MIVLFLVCFVETLLVFFFILGLLACMMFSYPLVSAVSRLFSVRVVSLFVVVVLVVSGLFLVVPSASVAAVSRDNASLRVGVVDSELSWVNFTQLGWYQARPPGAISELTRLGFDVVVLGDNDLSDRVMLDSLDVLVLPVTRVISEESELVLIDWLNDGGALVVALIGARVSADEGCVWSGADHPRVTYHWYDFWSCGRGADEGFTQWFESLNSNVFEWGPISQAYGMRLVNDPTSHQFDVIEASSHPIVEGMKSVLGLDSFILQRKPPGAGAEFVELFSGRTSTFLEFDIPAGTSSLEGFDMTEFDGFSAAQSGEFGLGRFVYFDFGVLDFLPQVNASVASQSMPGSSVSQGEVVSELLSQSIWWVFENANVSYSKPVDAKVVTFGEVDAWNSGIYVRQFFDSSGSDSAHVVTHLIITDPSGVVVFDEYGDATGVYPGGPVLRKNWGFVPDSGWLSSGEYEVLLLVEWSYPDYRQFASASLTVHKGEGLSLDTVAGPSGVLPVRVAGLSRFDTAVAVSESAFSHTGGVVYVATGENFPDALSATPAAVVNNAPILLTSSSSLPSSVVRELRRLAPSEIVVVGGVDAVSVSVFSSLESFAPLVRRIHGLSRFDTAAAVAFDTFSNGSDVAFVATGLDFPDALSAGPVAGLFEAPILLTLSDEVPKVSLRALHRLNVSRVVIVGGESVVSAEVFNQLVLEGFVVERVWGVSRFDTAAAMSRFGFSDASSVEGVFVATGENFPDALSGGVVAGLQGAPLLLVSRDVVPSASARELVRLNPDELVVLGGVSVVSRSVQFQLGRFIGL